MEQGVYTLRRVLLLSRPLNQLMRYELWRDGPTIIQDTELDEIRALCDVLEPFEKVIRESEGEKYVTLAQVSLKICTNQSK